MVEVRLEGGAIVRFLTTTCGYFLWYLQTKQRYRWFAFVTVDLSPCYITFSSKPMEGAISVPAGNTPPHLLIYRAADLTDPSIGMQKQE